MSQSITDRFSGAPTPFHSFTEWFAVTAGPNVLPTRPRALYIGTAGNITMVGSNGVELQFTNVPVGVLWVRPIKITAAGAGGIIALI